MDFDDQYIECSGLIDGWALKSANNERAYAQSATKDEGPFYCSECYSEAVVRKCVEKRDHFAHSARLSAVYQKGDRALHDKCKEDMCAVLMSKFPDGKWETERAMRENKEKGLSKLVPDISGRIQDIPVVIEIQASTLTLNEIKRRTLQYTYRGCAILWVVPLKETLGEKKFRPRLFEKYLHTMFYGRTYYWHDGWGATVQPIHYGPSERWIEERQWVEDGEERNEGGYNKTYKSIKTPVPERRLDIYEDFEKHIRKDFRPGDNIKKEVPECIIFRDTLDTWWKNEPEILKNPILNTVI